MSVALERDRHPTRRFYKLTFLAPRCKEPTTHAGVDPGCAGARAASQPHQLGFLLLESNPEGQRHQEVIPPLQPERGVDCSANAVAGGAGGADDSAAADAHSGSSHLRGMRVAEDLRGLGLGRLFLAVWMRLCADVGLAARANRIDKPRVCLLLHQLGFTPRHDGGGGGVRNVEVAIVRRAHSRSEDASAAHPAASASDVLELHSPSGLDLRGCFSAQELRSQAIAIADLTVSATGGGELPAADLNQTAFRVKVAFDGPCLAGAAARASIEGALARAEARLHLSASVGVLRSAFADVTSRQA